MSVGRSRLAALRRRVASALDRLEATFGRPRLGRELPPLDELILTILSQSTSDANRDRAYASLRHRFPTWEEVLTARRGDLEKAIRVGGLSLTKSAVIQAALRRIVTDQGRLSLDVLRRMPAPEARRYLMSFKGVGQKTAACVLLFACGREIFPVDTHIHRVTRRLGWVPAKADAGRSHAILGDLIPTGRFLTAHVNLITLGRRLCRPRAPDCPACPLRGSCPHAGRSTRVKGARRAGSAGVAVSREAGPAWRSTRSRLY